MAYSIRPLSGKDLKHDTDVWAAIPVGFIIVLFAAISICCICEDGRNRAAEKPAGSLCEDYDPDDRDKGGFGWGLGIKSNGRAGWGWGWGTGMVNFY